MPCFARVLRQSTVLTGVTLALAVLPSTSAGQGTDSAPPIAAGHRPAAAPGVRMDPWLLVGAGTSARTARTNIETLDRALEPYGTTYSRLPAEERSRIRQAYEEVVPGQRFSRYRLNLAQARGLVYVALGPWERCERLPRRRGGDDGCSQTIDQFSRDAAWIHSTIRLMGRASSRRSRAEELADLQAMTERSRQMVLGSFRCGCPGARDQAEALLGSTREALDTFESSSLPAWMSLGSPLVQRIARHSEDIDRTYIRCLGGG